MWFPWAAALSGLRAIRPEPNPLQPEFRKTTTVSGMI